MNTNKQIKAAFIPAKRISDFRYTFPGQFHQQTAFFELDTQSGLVNAMHNPEIGNAIPFSVYHGFDRRYGFNPNLKMRTVNEIGKKCIELWQRVINGTEVVWDGNNNVARLTEDAHAAEAEIIAIIEAAEYENL